MPLYTRDKATEVSVFLSDHNNVKKEILPFIYLIGSWSTLFARTEKKRIARRSNCHRVVGRLVRQLEEKKVPKGGAIFLSFLFIVLPVYSETRPDVLRVLGSTTTPLRQSSDTKRSVFSFISYYYYYYYSFGVQRPFGGTKG